MSEQLGIDVEMVRYECLNCDSSVTMVVSDQSRRAWRDHMLTHARYHRFREWHWTIQCLPLEFRPDPDYGNTERVVATRPRRR